MDLERVIRVAFMGSALLINGCTKDKSISESAALTTKSELLPSSPHCFTNTINIGSNLLQKRTLC